MKDACAISGLNVMRIISEPTSAALNYFYHYKDIITKPITFKYLLIIHFGGATFDASVVTTFEYYNVKVILNFLLVK